MPPTTREKLVSAAMQLFYARGYEVTSLKDVTHKAGAAVGSHYYYFKSKEDLLVAVLEAYRDLLWPVVMKPVFDHTADPIERIFGIMQGYRRMLTGSAFRSGCPIGNLALEIGEKSDQARKLIAENFASWRKVVQKCLEDAGDRLPADLDREQTAMFILTVMEGGIMQSRSERRIEPFDAGVSALRDYMRRMEEEATKRRSHEATEGKERGSRQ
ncbi:MAG: TetR/AcrR family transcriptional regulator [Phycisphaerae bacterium]|nr:TetR/AcrR family transcriptional regulator [Phycisphaerae bacterium]